MKRSIEHGLQAAAVSAAFLASAGETALAAVHADSHPTIAELARQIEAHPTVPAKTDYTAVLERNLPKHQRATVTVGAPILKGNKPDPTAASYISMSVMKRPQASNQPFAVPLESITFMKQADSSWNAASEAAMPGSPNTSIHIEETGGQTIQQFTQVVSGNLVQNLNVESQTDPQAAIRFFGSMEDGAEGFLQDVLHHRSVEQ